MSNVNVACIDCKIQKNVKMCKIIFSMSNTWCEPDKPWVNTHKELGTEIRQCRWIAGHLEPWHDFQQPQHFETGYWVTGSDDCWVSNTTAEFPPVSASHRLARKDLLEFPTVPSTQPEIAEGPHSGCGLNLSQNVLLEEDIPVNACSISCPHLPLVRWLLHWITVIFIIG